MKDPGLTNRSLSELKARALMTKIERERYERFLAAADERLARESEHLVLLRDRINLATVIEGGTAPKGLAVTSSQVRVRNLASGRAHIQTVSLPTDAEIQTSRALSSWAGPLLLGAREGDEVQWLNAGTLEQLRIEEVLYQPGLAEPSSGSPRKADGDESVGSAPCV